MMDLEKFSHTVLCWRRWRRNAANDFERRARRREREIAEEDESSASDDASDDAGRRPKAFGRPSDDRRKRVVGTGAPLTGPDLGGELARVARARPLPPPPPPEPSPPPKKRSGLGCVLVFMLLMGGAVEVLVTPGSTFGYVVHGLSGGRATLYGLDTERSGEDGRMWEVRTGKGGEEWFPLDDPKWKPPRPGEEGVVYKVKTYPYNDEHAITNPEVLRLLLEEPYRLCCGAIRLRDLFGALSHR